MTDEPETHEPTPHDPPRQEAQEPQRAAGGPQADPAPPEPAPARTGPQELVAGPVSDDTPITAADDYPIDPTHRMRLPSGVVFLLRKPNMITMISRGEIPNPLMSAVREVFAEEEQLDLQVRAEQEGRTEQEQRAIELDEQLRELAERPPEPPQPEEGLQFIDLVVYASVVAPPLSADPPAEPGGRLAKDGKLSLHAVADIDKMFISNWASEELGLVATFRPEREGADRERDGGTVRDDAEQPARDPEPAEQPVA